MAGRAVTVRGYDPAIDREWASREVAAAFGGDIQVRRGEAIDTSRLPGLVAERDGEPIGLLRYDPGGGSGTSDEVELAVLVTPVRGAGAGSALIAALRRAVPHRPIWVVTTNDNVDALRFYQRQGFRLRALRAGAVDDARRTLKPGIPATGAHDLPIHDELELVLSPGD
jgi:GNAT superfamily N-acetyltransferase